MDTANTEREGKQSILKANGRRLTSVLKGHDILSIYDLMTIRLPFRSILYIVKMRLCVLRILFIFGIKKVLFHRLL